MLFKADLDTAQLLAQLDCALWDSDTPVALAVESDDASHFLDQSMVAYLRDHQTENQAVVFDPVNENGIREALAEALAALIPGLNEEAFNSAPTSQWPQIWRTATSQSSKPHRLLIVDQFWEMLSASREQQQEFSQLLAQLASEKHFSVLAISDPDRTSQFHDLPGFEHLSTDADPVEEEEPEIIEIEEAAPEPELPEVRHSNHFLKPILLTAAAVFLALIFWNVGSTKAKQSHRHTQLSEAEPSSIELAGPKPPKLVPLERSALSFPNLDRSEPVRLPSIASLPIKPAPQYRLKIGIAPLRDKTFEPNYSLPTNDIAAIPRSTVWAKSDFQQQSTFSFQPSFHLPQLTALELVHTCQSLGLLQSTSDLRKGIDHVRKIFPKRQVEQAEAWLTSIEADVANLELHIADQFLKSGDLSSVYQLYTRHASRTGYPETHYHLGIAEMFGRGTAINQQAAVKSLTRAVDAGHADATYLLGVARLCGLGGLQKDELQAYTLFNEAINQGSKLAYREAARMSELGIGTTQDLQRAFSLYQQGSETGDPYSIKRLAEIYRTGENQLTPVDLEQAGEWVAKFKAASEDFVMFHARECIPDSFYNRAVLIEYY